MSRQTYIAIGLYSWGKGYTCAEAEKQRKRQGPSDRTLVIKKLPPGAVHAWLDEMGTIHWTWEEGADRSVKAETVWESP